jgi:GDP-mannose 6-dehydrogenase
MDKKLNISSKYLKPGFAFGGSCLPKDIRALLYAMKKLDLDLPLVNSILSSNKKQIELAFDLIKKTNKKKIGILGISFKPGTDDLRESPTIELIEKLLGKGYDVAIYDGDVAIAKVYGSNKKYIEKVIPHISCLMKLSIQEVIKNTDVIVICHNTDEFNKAIINLNHSKKIIDLVKINTVRKRKDSYEGICW